MTDFEIEKGMITGMVKSTFKGVRAVSAGCDDGKHPRVCGEDSKKN